MRMDSTTSTYSVILLGAHAAFARCSGVSRRGTEQWLRGKTGQWGGVGWGGGGNWLGKGEERKRGGAWGGKERGETSHRRERQWWHQQQHREGNPRQRGGGAGRQASSKAAAGVAPQITAKGSAEGRVCVCMREVRGKAEADP